MKITNETKVGIMISLVVAMLIVLTFKSGNFNFSKKGYLLKISFQNVDGVSRNAPVMLNGLEVGIVKDVNIVEGQDEVNMVLDVFLNEAAKVHEGAKAYVKNMGFLGEKYVGLTSGNPSLPYLEPDSVIVGDEPVDMDKLLADGRDIITDVKSASSKINERINVNSEKIDNIVANFDSSMENMVKITSNVNQRLEINAFKIDNTLSNLENSSRNLDQFTYDLKLNPWKLLYRSKEKRDKNIKEMMSK